MKRAFCIVAMLLLLQAQALGETDFRQAQAIGNFSGATRHFRMKTASGAISTERAMS